MTIERVTLRTDRAELSARALIESEGTAAHSLATQLSPAQRHLLECSLIAAHCGGSAHAPMFRDTETGARA